MTAQKIKLLVVDDNDFVRDLISFTFAEDPRFDIQEATTGQEGWQYFQASRPHVVLSDVMMPGEIDGLSLCQQIKHSTHPCTVILMSAKGQPSDIARGMQAGADSYQVKPISPLDLLALVKSFCA